MNNIKQEQKEKERQLKIKNSQVYSNQTGRTQSEKKNFLMICVGFFAALFESPAKKSEKREIKRFAKNKEDAPVALLSLKRDIKNYTDSLNQCLSLLGKEIDTVMDAQEFDRIQSLLDEFEEGYKQVLEKYEMIKDRHRIREEETVLGLTKSKEVILDDSMSEEAKQSILASTAFITARLEEIQEKFGYIPLEAQKEVSEFLKIPMAEIYGVITFYSRFTLKPKGKYAISVCLGTACFVKGSQKIMDRLKDRLKIESGETTKDGLFSIDETRCVGACGLAPVFTVNGEVYGKATVQKLDQVLDELVAKESKEMK